MFTFIQAMMMMNNRYVGGGVKNFIFPSENFLNTQKGYLYK